MSETQAILERLDSVRAETLRRFAPLTQAQLDWRPPGSAGGEAAWSLGEVFMHLAIDENYLRDNIARPLLEGVKPPDGLSFLPPPPAYATPKDVIEFWFARARLLTRRMLETLPSTINRDLKHGGGLDPMNGLEWFFGYAGHEAYHHRQLDALIAAVP
jgi:DinB family protein